MRLTSDLRLPPELWDGGRFPSLEQYREVLRRGRMLYNLDMETAEAEGERSAAAFADRSLNLLYCTAVRGGYRREGTASFKGPARNESLLAGVTLCRSAYRRLHQAGIPAIVYQNENNFDEGAFAPDEVRAMAAELDPFAWAFDNEGRRFACLNKPAWRDYLVERLTIRVGDTGADGVFMDNNTPFLHCRCAVCRDEYRRRFDADMTADMGRPATVVADMRVFDYVGVTQVPKDLVRVGDARVMRYLEWRIERIVVFYREIRRRLEERIGRRVVFTSNGHIGIAEQSAVMLAGVFDMVFSEDGFTAPPVSNGFNLRLGAAIGEGERCAFIVTRTTESAPTPGMLQALNAEGRALGGQAEFWDFYVQQDDRLLQAHEEMRRFFVQHAGDLFVPEQDANDTAILYSCRSDLWSSQAVSPAKKAAALLEDLNQPYDVLVAERPGDAARLGRYQLLLMPGVEILPVAFFDAVQRYLDNSGRVIATGLTATLDDSLRPRNRKLRGTGFCHFETAVEHEYFKNRKMIGIHTSHRKPECPLAREIEAALSAPSVTVEPCAPLLTLNRTRLPDGEALHIVNRHVNVFPQVRPVCRAGLSVRLRPARPVRRAAWLSPGQAEAVLAAVPEGDTLRINMPPLTTYGIVRLYYEVETAP